MPRKKTTPSKEPPQTINFDAAKKTQVLAKSAGQLAEFAATPLVAAEQLGIKTKPLEHFALSPAQLEALLSIPEISTSIKTKLAKDKASFTIAEVASMTMVLAEVSIESDPRKQITSRQRKVTPNEFH